MGPLGLTRRYSGCVIVPEAGNFQHPRYLVSGMVIRVCEEHKRKKKTKEKRKKEKKQDSREKLFLFPLKLNNRIKDKT